MGEKGDQKIDSKCLELLIAHNGHIARPSIYRAGSDIKDEWKTSAEEIADISKILATSGWEDAQIAAGHNIDNRVTYEIRKNGQKIGTLMRIGEIVEEVTLSCCGESSYDCPHEDDCYKNGCPYKSVCDTITYVASMRRAPDYSDRIR